MFKSTYDTDNDSVVDNVEKLEGNTLTQVRDHTPKTHTHTESDITDLDHDADKIKAILVDDAAAAHGKVLTYDTEGINPAILYKTPAAPGPLDAIRGDGTANRYFRGIYLLVQVGTYTGTLKCTVGNRWNGDTIAEQDNILKDAVTGHFHLTAAGTILHILNAGLTGDALYVNKGSHINTTGADFAVGVIQSIHGIRIGTYSLATGVLTDMTLLVEAGYFTLEISYITDA